MSNRTVLAVGAHPDDVEFMMAGTVILLKEAGYEPHIFTVGNGSCGTAEYSREEIIQMRGEEAATAAGVTGATYHPGLVDDIKIYYEESLLARVSAVVREVNPEIILAPSPEDYMEDHQNTCRLIVTAAFVFLTEDSTNRIKDTFRTLAKLDAQRKEAAKTGTL